jgi:hypothetical protein
MLDLAIDNGLVHQKDVKLLSIGGVDQFYGHLKNNPNMTYYGVVWCTTEWKVNENISIPCTYTHMGD